MSEQPNQDQETQQHNPEGKPSGTTAAQRKTRWTASTGGDQKNNKRSANFVIQGKGGSGKSVTATLIAQHIKETGEPLVCLDTDQINASFTATASLGVEQVDLLNSDNEVDVEIMNACVTRIREEDSHFVVDSGASGFVPLVSYLIDTNLFTWVAEKKRVVVHVPVVGGADLGETAHGLSVLISRLPEGVDVVCWKNPFFGPLTSAAGIPFEETDLYTEDCLPRLAGSVSLPALHPRYAGAAFRKLLVERMTFADAAATDRFDLITKMWLEAVWGPLKAQIAAVV